MILLAALMLAEPTPVGLARQKADIVMLKCFYGEATALDDHVSDAATIARAVVSACHPQFDDWKYANYAELQPIDATRFYTAMQRAASDIAVDVVLKVRVAKH